MIPDQMLLKIADELVSNGSPEHLLTHNLIVLLNDYLKQASTAVETPTPHPFDNDEIAKIYPATAKVRAPVLKWRDRGVKIPYTSFVKKHLPARLRAVIDDVLDGHGYVWRQTEETYNLLLPEQVEVKKGLFKKKYELEEKPGPVLVSVRIKSPHHIDYHDEKVTRTILPVMKVLVDDINMWYENKSMTQRFKPHE